MPSILITGASKGLGAEFVKAFWRQGWDILLVSRNEEELKSLVKSLPNKSNQKTFILPCDLSNQEDVTSLINNVNTNHHNLDGIINNAAIHGPIGPLINNDLKSWYGAMQVNFLSPVAICKGLIPLLANTGGGTIINISGGGATGPRENFTAYASSKVALVRFAETLSEEVKSIGINVNSIAPGAMKTALLKEVLGLGSNEVGNREVGIAEKVFKEGGASMDEVTKLALFLCQKSNRAITGKLISAQWDDWMEWANHIQDLEKSDVYTLRRITGKDRDLNWGDKS
jgi:3-oxoacyl-[acyl-carrier protein] reductase